LQTTGTDIETTIYIDAVAPARVRVLTDTPSLRELSVECRHSGHSRDSSLGIP
jgi:hypothetical protein